MKQSGILVHWNDEKGYGFIDPNSGGEKLFVHISSFRRNSKRPEQLSSVWFKASVDKKGRPCAVKVQLVGDEVAQVNSVGTSRISVFIAGGFLCFVGSEVLMGQLHHYIFGYYTLLSFFTFIVYGKDKWAAKRGAWRTPEQTLHFLAVLGGWPGAILAQQLLRHKSQKKSFRFMLIVTAIVNCVFYAWLSSPEGQELFQTYILDRLATQ